MSNELPTQDCTKQQLIDALLCMSNLDGGRQHDCKACPFHTMESPETIAEFRKENPENEWPDDFFEGCDFDSAVGTAAFFLMQDLGKEGKPNET